MRRRLRIAWCITTLRHRGQINHDDVGIYWECRRCKQRLYTMWEQVYKAIGVTR